MRVLTLVSVVALLATALAGCSAQSRDPDGDGLSNEMEERFGTDPDKADTDGDGLSDKEEAVDYRHLGADPLQADTDGDGLDDHAEIIRYGTDVSDVDPDEDDLNDYDEVITFGDWTCRQERDPPRCRRQDGPDPYEPDTDTDFFPDGPEADYWNRRVGEAAAIGPLNNSDTDGDGLLDGEDADPAFDLRMRLEAIELNLTRSFEDGGANVTVAMTAGSHRKRVHVGEVPTGPSSLDVTWTRDVDDKGQPTGTRTSASLQVLHDGNVSVAIDGTSSVVILDRSLSDYRDPTTGRRTVDGDDGSLTFRVTVCRDQC